MTILYSVSCKKCEKTDFATPNKEILTQRGYNYSCGYSSLASEGIIKEINLDIRKVCIKIKLKMCDLIFSLLRMLVG